MKNNLKLVTIVILSFMLFAQMAFVMVPTAKGLSATLKTDKSDYSPHETVSITGSGFTAGHDVTLTLTGPTGFSTCTWTVTADNKGKFQTTYSSGLTYGSFTLSATDGTNTATTTFHDFALDSFTISPDPSSKPLVAGYSYFFTLNATLPGNSGSSGVDVYLITSPALVDLASQGIFISYEPAFSPPEIKVPPNSHYGLATMNITIASDATSLTQPLTINAQDNPGGGGNIIGTFTVELHVNQYSLTIETNGLTDATYPADVTNGTVTGSVFDSTPFKFWYNVDHTTVTALAPQFTIDSTVTGAGGIHYLFNGWNDSTSSATHPSINMSNSMGLIANYVTQAASVTFYQNGASSDFTGTILTIDQGTSSEVNLGVSDLTGGKTYTWPVGASHTFAYASPLVVTVDSKQYTWTSTDQTGGLPTTQSGTITVSSTGGSVTGNYQTEYYLTVNNGDHGSAGGQGWYAANTNAQATMSPLIVDQSTDTRFVFAGWTDAASGSGSPSNNILMNGPKTATATWTTQYLVTFAVTPTGAGTTTPEGTDIWIDAGSLAISASPAAGYHFSQWTSDTGAITFPDSATAIVAGPGTVTANFAYNDVAYFVVSADSPQIAGVPFSITVTAVDSDGNRIGDYTGTVTFSTTDQGSGISLPGDYTFTSADQGSHTFTDGVTLVTAGSQTISASDNDNELTGQTTVIINANSDAPGSIVITPNPANVEAGKTITFKAVLLDIYGNELGDVTNGVTWSIDNAAGGDWDQATGTYTAAKASPTDSPWTVTATLTESVQGFAALTVTHSTDPSELVSVTLSPLSASIEAGNTQSYTATALDSYGNVWDVTAEISTANGWSISADAGGSWTDATYTSEKAGDWTVTGTYEDVSGTASLTVTHSTDVTKIDRVEVSLDPSSVAAPGTVTGTAIAYDIYGNSWDVSTDAAWSIPDGNDGGQWAGNVYTSHTAGTYTVQALYEEVAGTASLTVTHASDVAYLDYITASVDPTTIAAPGQVTGTATAYDTLGNSWDISTVAVWSIPAGGDGGQWGGNVYTSHLAGTHTVQAEYEGKTATATLTVTHSDDIVYLDHITASVDPTTVPAPGKVTGTATAYDSFGNSWDISTLSTWSIQADSDGGSWAANIYTSKIAGTYTVQAEYQGKTATASLTVTHATDQAYLDHIVIAPKTATVKAGVSQSYTATAYDTFGNSWTVDATYSCPSTNVAISGSSVTSNIVGSYTITGMYSGKSDTATLTVNANADKLDHITISPKTSTIAAGASQSYSVEAFDAYGNSLGTVTSSTTFTASGATVSGNSISASSGGTYTVTATYSSKTDTATLTVNAPPSTSPSTYTFTFIESGLPSGVSWSVNFNGVTKSTSGTAISFDIPGGNYRWNVIDKIYIDSGTRYQAYEIIGGGLVSVPGTTTQNIIFKQQYKLTVVSEHGSPVGDGWYYLGDIANASVTNIETAGSTRYQFTQWSGNLTSTQPSLSIKIETPLNITANWQTQYLLTIESLYGTATGANWYNAGAQAQFSIDATVNDASGSYSFVSWTGQGEGAYSGTDRTQTVTMNGPVVETASWEQSTSLYSVLLAALIILAIIISSLLLVWRRRRRKNKSAPSA